MTTDSAIDYPLMTLDLDEDSANDGILVTNFFYWSQPSGNFGGYTNTIITNQSFSSSIPLDVSYSSLDDSRQQFLWHFNAVDGTRLFKKGSVYNISLSAFGVSMREHGVYGKSNSGGGSSYYSDYTYSNYDIDLTKFSTCILRLFGSTIADYNTVKEFYFDTSDVLSSYNGHYNFNFENVEIPQDTYYMIVCLESEADVISQGSKYGSNYGQSVDKIFTFTGSFNNSSFVFEEADSSTGLLNAIIEWLRSIKNGITEVFESIVALPGRIWSFIETGLKNLFVPTQEDITQMSEDWNSLLKERFGALYQSADIVHQFAETLQNGTTESGGIITMPQTSVNLAGTNYSFGGFEVDLVPEGFDFLASAIKTIISIVCTIAFINALKNKLEGLMK